MSNPQTPAGDFDSSDPFADDLTPAELAEIERRLNINRLKNEAGELAGGQMTGSESSEASSEITEQFWENVVAFERAPLVTMHRKLAKAGLEMPADDQLSDADLTTKLWQIIEWMAQENTVLENTNHLSDRELYVWLRDDWFHDADADMPGMTCHTSPIGSYGPEDMVIYHRYYADESARARWLQDFPGDEMPPHEDPPFDRDQWLPDSRLHREFHQENLELPSDEELL